MERSNGPAWLTGAAPRLAIAGVVIRRRPGWADLSLASLVVGVALVAWFLLESNFDGSQFGLWQRALLAVALGWQAVVALRVRRLALRLETAAAL